MTENLDVRKFLKSQALVGSFRILLFHFIAIKQFGGRINKNKLGLSCAKLSSSWDLTVVKFNIHFVSLYLIL